MEKIHILTDSSSDIPHDLVEAHGIEIVPIMLTHEGRSFREYYDIIRGLLQAARNQQRDSRHGHDYADRIPRVLQPCI